MAGFLDLGQVSHEELEKFTKSIIEEYDCPFPDFSD